MQESLREAENKKRTLEENIDALREEFAKVKAAGLYILVSLTNYDLNQIFIFIYINILYPC